jgi:NtrC-family two-component system sensor histidine kinase KinB
VIERARSQVFSGKGAHVPKGLDEAARHHTAHGDRHFLPRASPVYDEDGSIVAATIVLQDVTRLMRVDQLRNDLVATVAHELRTPLTSIAMAVHLCVEQVAGPLNAKQADLLFAAKEDCDRLQKLVEELLDMSRVQEGTMPLRKRPLAPEEIIRHALRAGETEAAAANVTLRSQVLPGSGEVDVDPERLQIVMSNLLSNAIHHSPPGGTVVARASSVEQGIEFEVLDEGPGIPADARASVFDRYYQAPGGHAGARGLGLAIAKEIIEQHGGAIGVDGAAGGGARFWFRLPVSAAQRAAGGRGVLES